MKLILIALLAGMPVCSVAADTEPEVVLIDPRVIHATIERRRAWVNEQATGPGAWWYEQEFEWIIAAKSIGPNEARQLAYFFFYSTGTKGGYFDAPILEGSCWKLRFHPELGTTEGYPVYVETVTGRGWQEGQTEKVDVLALIRLFAETRKGKAGQPARPDNAG